MQKDDLDAPGNAQTIVTMDYICAGTVPACSLGSCILQAQFLLTASFAAMCKHSSCVQPWSMCRAGTVHLHSLLPPRLITQMSRVVSDHHDIGNIMIFLHKCPF